ncbi:hypothetical protein [Streptomyces sp. NPDC057302]|uniref:hypothetical protein n=1 Tax=Streptomyces sp. NPDC057302 TaxID=3346094 RepID=UPI00363EA38F
MFIVTTTWEQWRTVKGKTTSRQLSSEKAEFEWPDGVAGYVVSFLTDHPGVVISGTEDFGIGSCALDPISVRCRTHGDCRTHHIESVKQWIESRVDELKPEASTDLCGGRLKSFSIEIKRMAEPEPDEDPPA